MSDDPEQIGKGRPPNSGRWQKGVSGNRNGRPKGKKSKIPYDHVLDQIMMIREDGVERNVSAEEAFLLYLANSGLSGDAVHAGFAIQALEDVSLTSDRPRQLVVIQGVYPADGDVTQPMRSLGVARVLDRFRPTARVALEPWIVEAALDRLGDRTLSVEEQQVIVAATRTPNKVAWPEWWNVMP